MATLRANWGRVAGPFSKLVSGQVAQACEYGELMGQEALRRQWAGSPSGQAWKQVCRKLDWEERHLKSVA